MTDMPTYTEVVAYANAQGLIGKIDTSKFYDFYERQGFLYRGQPMDWKGKMFEWANNQKSQVTQTKRELAELERLPKPQKFRMPGGRETYDLREYLGFIEKRLCRT